MKRSTGALMIASFCLIAGACASDSNAPAGAIQCSVGDPLCPAVLAALGFSGDAGAPTITPTSSATSVTTANTAIFASGSTSATANGLWLIVVGNQLRASGVLAVASGLFAADIPLFCGTQSLLYSFTTGAARSYWRTDVTVNGCTTAEFRVQLSWDTGPSSDIDLHLLRPAGTMFSGNDCYYSNCQGSPLEWGTAGAPGNPLLDVDDTEGWGPENIVIGTDPETGEYRIVVHNYDGSLATRATVKLYFNDVEQQRWTSLSLDPGTRDFWEVARVNILSGAITTVNTYAPTPPAIVLGAAPAGK